jgi:hypothetical protein
MIVSICVVSKEYRYVEIEAGSKEEAIDKAWDDMESILNRKAVDYDTDLYVDSVEEGSIHHRTYRKHFVSR